MRSTCILITVTYQVTNVAHKFTWEIRMILSIFIFLNRGDD